MKTETINSYYEKLGILEAVIETVSEKFGLPCSRSVSWPAYAIEFPEVDQVCRKLEIYLEPDEKKFTLALYVYRGEVVRIEKVFEGLSSPLQEIDSGTLEGLLQKLRGMSLS
jgi:hypothetical protein